MAAIIVKKLEIGFENLNLRIKQLMMKKSLLLLLITAFSFITTYAGESIIGKWKIVAIKNTTAIEKSYLYDLYKNNGVLEFLADNTIQYGHEKTNVSYTLAQNSLTFVNHDQRILMGVKITKNQLELTYNNNGIVELYIFEKQ